MKHKVFVYGTLKKGYGNHKYFLKGKSSFVGMAHTVEPFWLVDIGFPYMIRRHHEKQPLPVVGEIYETDEQTMKKLDHLEGVDCGHYTREKIDVRDENGELIEVNAYIHVGNCHNLPLCEEVEGNYVWSK